MDWDRRRFDDRRGGESYRPADRSGRSPSRAYDRYRRSPPRNRSRPRADTWVPSNRSYGRPRSRSPPEYRRRSRTPPFQGRGYGPPYGRRRSPPRRPSPRRDDRIRSPPPSWRSRSPYSDGRSRDVSRGRSSPRRPRDATPGSQEFRGARRSTPTVPNPESSTRTLSPRAQPAPVFRSRSPSHALPRREQPSDLNRDRSLLRSRPSSPAHALAADSNVTSRRSSPVNYAERGGQPPNRSRSRSPNRQSPSHRVPRPLAGSPYPDRDRDRSLDHESAAAGPAKGQGVVERPAEISESARSSNIPTQPRGLGTGGQLPPSGPSQGPRMASSQNRGSHNLSLLAAPTRPRRGPGSREGSWPNAPAMRRGPPANVSPNVPSGPRASFTPPMPAGPGGGGPGGPGGYRHPGSRSNSAAFPASSPIPKGPNYLAGLATLVPGGRALPSVLDSAAERRLMQLDVDRERLLEHIAATQASKRAGLRDWDRLDRESSICALKSELAEGHLQRMADESIGGGIPF